MFGLFKKDPVKRLEKEYAAILEEAKDVQRSGDLRAYADLISKSEEVMKKIEALKAT